MGVNKNILDYVNPFIGTAPMDGETVMGPPQPGQYEYYTGTEIPGAELPDGNVQLSPDTGFSGPAHVHGSGYHYDDESIMGFSHTHNDWSNYSNVLFMPTIGEHRTRPGSLGWPHIGYRSMYDDLSEESSPGYYAVALEDYDITVELTATEDVGIHRYTFPETKTGHVLIDLGLSQDRIEDAAIELVDDTHLKGWQECVGREEYTVYFHAEFSKRFDDAGIWQDRTIVDEDDSVTGSEIGAYVDYETSRNEEITVKVGISFESEADAAANVADVAELGFEDVRERAEERWLTFLNRITVRGGTTAQRELFYTCLYRSVPHQDAVQTLIRPEKVEETYTDFDVESLGAAFWGWGQAATFEDLCERGFDSFDIREVYTRLKSLAMPGKPTRVALRPWEDDLEGYWDDGYFPASSVERPTVETHGQFSVARTLGYAYADYCLALLAKRLGEMNDYETFRERAKNYQHVFDSSTRFMRGKTDDGSWVEPFYPDQPYHFYVYQEGNAWQWTWFVPHDVQGLLQLFGGREAFETKLDRFFDTPYAPERPEWDTTGMLGQYCHGNETEREVPYYYNYCGQPSKTQDVVREVLETLYRADPGGLCGMDDGGLLSSWFVYSALGFYRDGVHPGVSDRGAVYLVGSPIFERAIISLGDQDNEDTPRFEIVAKNVSKQNRYVQSASLNGIPLIKPWFTHDRIADGGSLVLEMGPEPSDWGSHPTLVPPSMTHPTDGRVALRGIDLEIRREQTSVGRRTKASVAIENVGAAGPAVVACYVDGNPAVTDVIEIAAGEERDLGFELPMELLEGNEERELIVTTPPLFQSDDGFELIKTITDEGIEG